MNRSWRKVYKCTSIYFVVGILSIFEIPKMGDSLLTSIVFFTTTNKVLTMNFSCNILILIERKNLCQHIRYIKLFVDFLLVHFFLSFPGAVILSQWFQPREVVSEIEVTKQLDQIADRVKQHLPEHLKAKYNKGEASVIQVSIVRFG